MDIKERVLSVGAAEQAAADRQRQQQKQRWYRYFLSPLWVILLLTLLLRVWLIVRTQGFIDGDEALLGIQAEKILQGIFPIYFYGQPYMGSLSAYLTAIIFAIVGPSTWAMRAEPALLSLLMLALTWKFAGLLAEVANLPLYARKYFVIVATLLAAIPPLYDGVIELRTFGGYIETFVLMLLLLISALQLPRRWQAGASSRELALRWAGIGFVVGLGMWVYPLIVSAILAAALWIAAVGAIEIVRQWKQIPAGTKRTFSTIVHSARGILLAVVAIPAAIVGFMPGIIWGATHQWANVAYIASTGGGIGNRLYTMRRIEYVYRTCIVPRVISGALPTESNLMASIHMPLLIAGVFCIAATAALIGLSFLWHLPVLLRIPRLTTLPLLFGVCTAITFITARNSEHTLNAPCASYDPSGRYATPLVLAMPFFFAALFTVISMYLHYRSEKRLQAHMAGALPAGIAYGKGGQEGSRRGAGAQPLLYTHPWPHASISSSSHRSCCWPSCSFILGRRQQPMGYGMKRGLEISFNHHFVSSLSPTMTPLSPISSSNMSAMAGQPTGLAIQLISKPMAASLLLTPFRSSLTAPTSSVSRNIPMQCGTPSGLPCWSLSIMTIPIQIYCRLSTTHPLPTLLLASRL